MARGKSPPQPSLTVHFFIYVHFHLKYLLLDGDRAFFVWLLTLSFLLCSAFLFRPPPRITVPSTCTPSSSASFVLCIIWLHGFALFFFSCLLPSPGLSSLSLSCHLFLPVHPSCLFFISLSQITVSVAQGRVRSPSPQPRYKSYAYTQAAYVKSPEQKRRRFTDQVRVSQR